MAKSKVAQSKVAQSKGIKSKVESEPQTTVVPAREQPLSAYFSLQRRYYRSVNLERDFDKTNAVQGYILTERSGDALRRMIAAFGNRQAHRAWTMTGSYGTGKSAFAHYLACLCAPQKSPVHQEAMAIARYSFGAESPELQSLEEQLPKQGLFRAVATGQREPLTWTIVRALANGAEQFWHQKNTATLQQLTDWRLEIARGNAQITPQQVLSVLADLIQAAKVNLLIVLDELGKNLEFAAHHRGIEDLYLLQQIAELQFRGEHQVYFLGILHQSFAGYSERLAAVEQSEWSKIQGRFEDIPFTESPNQMIRLIAQAIDPTQADPILPAVQQQAKSWSKALEAVLSEQGVPVEILTPLYPLHPIAALVLPILCVRYAQNDRSLFTFLTGDEPHAFEAFLRQQAVNADSCDEGSLPTLKLYQIYDYFVESVTGLASRVNLQRWVEVQNLIQDVSDRNPQILQVLKTIGILNLVASVGTLRASARLVALALCDRPGEQEQEWQQVIEELQQKGVITYRRQADELRIWEGSDFNVESAIYEILEKMRSPLAELLGAARPLKPLVAQRHYSTTGTLRYFEQVYVEGQAELAALRCTVESSDGLIAYWMDQAAPPAVPTQTLEGKPLVVVSTCDRDLLRIRAQELQALKQIQKEAPELQNDGVARREVRHRLVEAERLLAETLNQVFDWSEGKNQCWIEGEAVVIPHAKAFQSALSDLCDAVYPQGLVLDNELINRRELTSQGAKARRELIEAMLERGDQERLGLVGYGPEVAMYYSLLEHTGIHDQEEDSEAWGFYPPYENAGVESLWQAIETFCLEAKEQQRSLDHLYRQLAQPPYGVKAGVIPVLLAAVLLHHVDDIGVYRDGTFIPILGAEHFELLVKDPARFAVKSFEMTGLRSQVFKALESILRSPTARMPAKVRNESILAVAKPLFQFVKKLPAYTLKTQHLSPEALAVLKALQQAQEPDELLFRSLPQAFGLAVILPDQRNNAKIAKELRQRLVQALHEIQTAYDALLTRGQGLLRSAFSIRQDETKLREDLRVWAGRLVDRCIEPTLRRLILAAVDEQADDRTWLEALLMVIADKPATAWSDEDAVTFELKLSTIAQQFKNLVALQAEVESRGEQEGFEVRRLTLTNQNGEQRQQVVWADPMHWDKAQEILDEIYQRYDLAQNVQLRQALMTRFTDRALNTPLQDDLARSRNKTRHPSRSHLSEG
ncbi:MAG: hypothetical protein MUF49_14220 [Oculatellaceae cyanobacterium Prado106]|nr:hypothetical protein [Oculatellaceae cyanobacterium Prado106]